MLAENLDSSMPAHTKGREENLPVETQIRSLRILGPLDGAPGTPTIGHPLCCFIPCSGCSGGSNTIGGFCLRILSFGRPHNNCGAHFGYGCRIPLCKGHVVRGVGSRIKSFLLRLSSTPVEPHHFASSVVTPHAIKLAWLVLRNVHLPA
jgi:hypothetical protein